LGDSFEEPEKTYSAGMRLRLGFTTALMTQVDILLIDEVLSAGDGGDSRRLTFAIRRTSAAHAVLEWIGQVRARLQSTLQ
jgi:lipopolysaccharide transport system ATP-binding protein